jgi:site-specific DNA recombinase
MVLIEEFEKGGCRVGFVRRPMSSEPDDQLLLQIRGAVAEYERTLLSERMRPGRLAKYKAGSLLPRTHTPYGLRVDPDRPRDPDGVRPDEEKAAVVAEIFAVYLERGASLFGVSRHLEAQGIPAPRGGKVWSVATLRGIPTNPVYAGRTVCAERRRYRIRQDTALRYSPHRTSSRLGRPAPSGGVDPGGQRAGGGEPGAVRPRKREALQEQILRAAQQQDSRVPLEGAGELRHLCMLCSVARTRTGKNAKQRQRYYVCSGKFKQARSYLEEECPSRYAPADRLDEAVWKSGRICVRS